MSAKKEASGLVAAIGQVMASVGYVQKEGRVQGGGVSYSFAGEAHLLRALRPAMLEAGLVLLPVRTELREHHETVETKHGLRPSRTVRALVTYRLAHVGGDSVEIQVAGEGQDAGDKATPKAMTIALKYALRQTFLIETGDDPDRERPEAQYDESEPTTRPAADTRIEALAAARQGLARRLDEAGCKKGDGGADAIVRASRCGPDTLAAAWGSLDAIQAVIDWIDGHDKPETALWMAREGA